MPYKDKEQNLEKVRRHRRNNKPKYAAKQKKYYEDNPAIYLRIVCKTRAKKVGLDFTLTDEDFKIPTFCPVLDIPLYRGTKAQHGNSPSVDRLNQSLGYVKGNIAIISHRANRLKSDHSVEDIEKVIDWWESGSKHQSMFSKQLKISHQAFSGLSRRAKKAGFPFDLAQEDLPVPDFCPVLGVELLSGGTRQNKFQSPSVDKFVPALGYVRGNVSIMSYGANRIKSDATLNELKKVAKWMKNL